jgi:hypothetical protein
MHVNQVFNAVGHADADADADEFKLSSPIFVYI